MSTIVTLIQVPFSFLHEVTVNIKHYDFIEEIVLSEQSIPSNKIN